MDLTLVPVALPEGTNVIIGQSHFIKTVEDLYEVMATTVPQAKFGLAFNEASGARLIRADGNDQGLTKAAVDAAQAIGGSPDISSILILPRLDWWLDRVPDVDAMVRGTVTKMKEAADDSPVPVALALRVPENARIMGAFERFYEYGAEAGLPVFPDFERALVAMSRFISWQEARAQIPAR